jgi:hypothetical protein
LLFPDLAILCYNGSRYVPYGVDVIAVMHEAVELFEAGALCVG